MFTNIVIFVWPVNLERACDGPEGGSDDLAGQYGPCYGSGVPIGQQAFSSHCCLDKKTLSTHLLAIMTRVTCMVQFQAKHK